MINKRFGVYLLLLLVIAEAWVIYFFGFYHSNSKDVSTDIVEQTQQANEIKQANNAINASYELQRSTYLNNLLINYSNYEKSDTDIILLDADSTISLLAINLSKAANCERRHLSRNNDTTSKANK